MNPLIVSMSAPFHISTEDSTVNSESSNIYTPIVLYRVQLFRYVRCSLYNVCDISMQNNKKIPKESYLFRRNKNIPYKTS